MIKVEDISSTVQLLKQINCSTHALIKDVAREMSVKQTALMSFINSNPKLFQLCEVHKRKSKNLMQVVGLAISHVYLSPKDNPDTEEWLEAKKQEWEHKLYVAAMDYYGHIEFYYIPIDEPKCSGREELWRNTRAKVEALEKEGILKKVKAGVGSLGDYTTGEWYILTTEVRLALAHAGWTLDDRN